MISMYKTFQMHEDDESILNPNLEVARYYVILNIEFTSILVV